MDELAERIKFHPRAPSSLQIIQMRFRVSTGRPRSFISPTHARSAVLRTLNIQWLLFRTLLICCNRWISQPLWLARQLWLRDTPTEASVLIQMRTEKIGLYGYLYKIKRQDDPWCGCDQAYQTVRHVIKDCEYFKDERLQHLKVKYISDARLFFTDSKLIPKVTLFMLATNLLDQFAIYAKTLSLL